MEAPSQLQPRLQAGQCCSSSSLGCPDTRSLYLSASPPSNAREACPVQIQRVTANQPKALLQQGSGSLRSEPTSAAHMPMK